MREREGEREREREMEWERDTDRERGRDRDGEGERGMQGERDKKGKGRELGRERDREGKREINACHNASSSSRGNRRIGNPGSSTSQFLLRLIVKLSKPISLILKHGSESGVCLLILINAT